MEGLMKGDGRVACWPYPGNPAPLPPRSPSFPSAGCPPLDSRTAAYTGHKKFSHNLSQRQHQRSPSASFLMEEQFSWLDDLLDDSDISTKKVSHRRSASDSFTFLETPGTLYRISDISEEEEFDCSSRAAQQTRDFTDRDHSDTGQLMSLLAEVEKLQRKKNLPLSISNTYCKPENIGRRLQATSTAVENALAFDSMNVTGTLSEGASQHFLRDLEAHDLVEEEEQVGAWSESMACLDPSGDPKRTKRQSAQRSRVRKLQYIAELEKTVNSLQTAVSALSPQVTYLEHKRMLLNMDNTYLKKRVALLAKEKNVKDAQNKALIKEVQNWRQIYQFQLQDHKQLLQTKEMQPKEHGYIYRHKSLPSNFDIPLEEFGKLNLNTPLFAETRPAASNAFVGLISNFSAVPSNTAVSAGTSCNNG